jgi:hypothetical protein
MHTCPSIEGPTMPRACEKQRIRIESHSGVGAILIDDLFDLVDEEPFAYWATLMRTGIAICNETLSNPYNADLRTMNGNHLAASILKLVALSDVDFFHGFLLTIRFDHQYGTNPGMSKTIYLGETNEKLRGYSVQMTLERLAYLKIVAASGGKMNHEDPALEPFLSEDFHPHQPGRIQPAPRRRLADDHARKRPSPMITASSI